MLPLLVKKVDWDEEKGIEGGDLGVDRVKDEISISAQIFFLTFWLVGFGDFGAFLLNLCVFKLRRIR